MQHPESILQEQIVEYLRLRHIVVFSVPGEAAGGGRAAMIKTVRMKRMGLMPGVSDLVTVRHNKIDFLEVKSDKGKQSESQKSFQKIVEALGHEYHIVKSLEDIQAIFKMSV